MIIQTSLITRKNDENGLFKNKMVLFFFPSKKITNVTSYTFENDYSFKKLFFISIDNHHTIVLFKRFFCIDKLFFFTHSLHSRRDRGESVKMKKPTMVTELSSRLSESSVGKAKN